MSVPSTMNFSPSALAALQSVSTGAGGSLSARAVSAHTTEVTTPAYTLEFNRDTGVLLVSGQASQQQQSLHLQPRLADAVAGQPPELLLSLDDGTSVSLAAGADGDGPLLLVSNDHSALALAASDDAQRDLRLHAGALLRDPQARHDAQLPTSAVAEQAAAGSSGALADAAGHTRARRGRHDAIEPRSGGCRAAQDADDADDADARSSPSGTGGGGTDRIGAHLSDRTRDAIAAAAAQVADDDRRGRARGSWYLAMAEALGDQLNGVLADMRGALDVIDKAGTDATAKDLGVLATHTARFAYFAAQDAQIIETVGKGSDTVSKKGG